MLSSSNLKLKDVIVVTTVKRFTDLRGRVTDELGVRNEVIISITNGQIVVTGSTDMVKESSYKLMDFKRRFPKERFAVLMDNYFSDSELNGLSFFSEYRIFLINYGVYLCRDEVSMTFPRVRQYPKLGLLYSSVRLKIKFLYQGLKYFGKLVDVRTLVYSNRIILFWNETSESNFLRDYPYASTLNLGLYERANNCLSPKFVCEHVLLAPTALGHNHSVLEAELIYWKDITRVLRGLGAKTVVLSIHPMYFSNLKTFVETEFFDRVVCGVTSMDLQGFDLLLTDTSTLFWTAPLFGVRSKRLRGFKIPNDYYGDIHEIH